MKYDLQEALYQRPYHHLVDVEGCKTFDELSWGLEYYSYLSHILALPFQGSLIADIGCGDGKVSIELAKRHPDATFHGYDLSERAIRFAHAYALPNTHFFPVPFSSSPHQYDAAYCIETFEHIPDSQLQDFAASIRNHLKPGAPVIVSVPSDNLPTSPKHYRHYNIALLTEHVGLPLESFCLTHSPTSWWIRFLLSNRFFILRAGRKLLFHVYNLSYKYSPRGTHVVAVFRNV